MGNMQYTDLLLDSGTEQAVQSAVRQYQLSVTVGKERSYRTGSNGVLLWPGQGGLELEWMESRV